LKRTFDPKEQFEEREPAFPNSSFLAKERNEYYITISRGKEEEGRI